MPGDLGFDRQRLDDWASGESGIGYNLMLPRHQLKLCLTKEVFEMCCLRGTEPQFFLSGGLWPRPTLTGQ